MPTPFSPGQIPDSIFSGADPSLRQNRSASGRCRVDAGVMPRKSAPGVPRGRVRKKANWRPDRGDYVLSSQDEIRLDRRDPGPGYRHVITISQLREFVGLLPGWDEIAGGLDAIVLDRGRDDAMGWYRDGVVYLCAWPAHSGFWMESDREWNRDNEALLSLLGVEIDEQDGRVGLLWTEPQARAFMLLDVLPHELGHHRDMMITASRRVSRGEKYAHSYAKRVLEQVWPIYTRHFEL